MNRPTSPRSASSSLKRKRSVAQDYLQDRSGRPTAEKSLDSSNSQYSTTPPRGLRGVHSQLSTQDKRRDQEDNWRMDELKPPDRRSSLGRDERHERDWPSASTYRPEYSEKTRARIYPDSKGTDNRPRRDSRQTEAPAAITEGHGKAITVLTGLFTKIIDEATNVAALKSQHSTAENLLKKRNEEYAKFKSHHEKYPSTAESQKRVKELAEKDCKGFEEKLNRTQSTLLKLANEAAASIIPSTLSTESGPDKTELQRLQAQNENLEKTFQTIKLLLDEQRKFVEGERKERLRLEEKLATLEKKSLETEKIQREQAHAKDLVQKDYTQIVEMAKKVEDKFESLRISVQGNGTSQVPGIANNLNQLTQCQNSFRSELSVLNHEVQQLKTMEGELKTIEGRLKHVELAPSKETESRLLKLQGQISGLQKLPDQLEDLDKRLAMLKTEQEGTNSVTWKEVEAAKNQAIAVDGRLILAEAKINEVGNNVAEVAAGDSTLSQRVQELRERRLPVAGQQGGGDVAGQLVTMGLKITSITTQLSQRITEMDSRVEANAFGVASLDARFQGINTRDLAMHMINVLSDTFPNVRDCQNSLVAFETNLRQLIARFGPLEARCGELQTNFIKLVGEFKSLKDGAQQGPAQTSVPVSVDNTKTSLSLRSEVDTLTRTVGNHSNDLSVQKSLIKKLIQDQEDIKEAYEKLPEDVAKVLDDRSKQNTEDLAGIRLFFKSAAETLDQKIKHNMEGLASVEKNFEVLSKFVSNELSDLHIRVDCLEDREVAVIDTQQKQADCLKTLGSLQSERSFPIAANGLGNNSQSSHPRSAYNISDGASSGNSNKRQKLNGPTSQNPLVVNGTGPNGGRPSPARFASGNNPTSQQ